MANAGSNKFDGMMSMQIPPQPQLPSADQLKLKIPKDRIKSDMLDYANQPHANLANSHDPTLSSTPALSSTSSLKIKISKDCLDVSNELFQHKYSNARLL